MRDGRDDFFGSGCDIKNAVTIDTDRHGVGSLGERKALLTTAGCRKCICVTFDKSNKTKKVS